MIVNTTKRIFRVAFFSFKLHLHLIFNIPYRIILTIQNDAFDSTIEFATDLCNEINKNLVDWIWIK